MTSIYEWAQDRLDSHAIFDSTGLGADFREITGHEPCWPEYTPEETRAAIEARGLGGSLYAQPAERLANGWEIANALADRFAPGESRPPKMGRGSQFREALAALERAGF